MSGPRCRRSAPLAGSTGRIRNALTWAAPRFELQTLCGYPTVVGGEVADVTRRCIDRMRVEPVDEASANAPVRPSVTPATAVFPASRSRRLARSVFVRLAADERLVGLPRAPW